MQWRRRPLGRGPLRLRMKDKTIVKRRRAVR
jgi:hypothetical protein